MRYPAVLLLALALAACAQHPPDAAQAGYSIAGAYRDAAAADATYLRTASPSPTVASAVKRLDNDAYAALAPIRAAAQTGGGATPEQVATAQLAVEAMRVYLAQQGVH